MGNDQVRECDVLVVGAGFGGIYAIYKFRQLGLNVHCFEAGGDLGGVWYWNRYPGARVDSEFPLYQLTIPEVWKDWNFGVRFPDHKELRRLFAHVDKVLDIRKDTTFNAKVNSAVWDASAARWTVKSEDGHVASCKYLFLASGLLHKEHLPDFPGISDFKGEIYHSARFREDLDVRGKKVAVVGAGATSVQIVQDLAKEAGHLTMLMRRPSHCLAMMQRAVSEEEQTQLKSFYPSLFITTRDTPGGFIGPRATKSIWETTPEEREAYWEENWKRGAFQFIMGNYMDCLVDPKANRLAYDFWAKKVRARIKNTRKADLMAPKEPTYPFGTKRTPLEADYYEMIDKDNVEIVNLLETPIKTFTSTGMALEDGSQLEFDIIVLATGFDAFSGSLTNMGLTSKNGVDIKEIWSQEIASYMGLLIADFPNLFMIYSPQAPTAFANGPTILECQTDLIVDAIKRLEFPEEGQPKGKSIEATKEAQDAWVNLVEEMAKPTLFPATSSWWTGANFAGRKAQMLTYIAGISTYEKTCGDALGKWEGCIVTYEDGSVHKSEQTKEPDSVQNGEGKEDVKEDTKTVAF